jgi:hypothetical protein
MQNASPKISPHSSIAGQHSAPVTKKKSFDNRVMQLAVSNMKRFWKRMADQTV